MTPNPFSTLRAGIAGSGFIAPVHIEALRRIGVRVTAICGLERAREVAARWDIPLCSRDTISKAS